MFNKYQILTYIAALWTLFVIFAWGIPDIEEWRTRRSAVEKNVVEKSIYMLSFGKVHGVTTW